MTCPGCGKTPPANKKTGRPRVWCSRACTQASKRERYRIAPVASADNCPRCDMPVSSSSKRGNVCRSCSAQINRRIAGWLEERSGTILDLAIELGISGFAATKRISRIRQAAQ